MTDKRIVFHVGIPKTGTTSLQKNIFRNLDYVANLGKPNPIKEHRRFLSELRYGTNREFTQIVEEYRKVIEESEKSTVIISEELILSGDISCTLIAQRLHQMFPSARILLSIREQFSCIRSAYMSHGQFLGKTPLSGRKDIPVSFEQWWNFFCAKNSGIFRQLDYCLIAEAFLEFFPKENIEVIALEQFVKAPEKACQRLSNSIGGDPQDLLDLWINAGPKNKGARRLRPSTRILRRLHQLLAWRTKFKSSGQVKFSDHQVQMLKSRYGRQNFTIAREFDLPLEDWGYFSIEPSKTVQ